MNRDDECEMSASGPRQAQSNAYEIGPRMVPDAYRMGSTRGVATSTIRTTQTAPNRPGPVRARPDRITRWSWWVEPSPARHDGGAAAPYFSWNAAFSELPSAVTMATAQHVFGAAGGSHLAWNCVEYLSDAPFDSSAEVVGPIGSRVAHEICVCVNAVTASSVVSSTEPAKTWNLRFALEPALTTLNDVIEVGFANPTSVHGVTVYEIDVELELPALSMAMAVKV